MIRILAVDYGRKRIGLAVGVSGDFSARGLETLEASNVEAAVAGVSSVAVSENVKMILVGLPLNMDGSRGEMADAAARFANELADRTGIPTTLVDERLTSAQAHRALRESGRKTRDKKGLVDRVAAVLLLENYLQQNAL